MKNSRTMLGRLATVHPNLQAVLFGLLVAGLLVAVYQISMRLGLQGSQRIIDDILGGAIAGLLLFLSARARTRFLRERLETIALMNHHVRNALQVVTYSGYIRPDPEAIAQVNSAVERIEWALREILPGANRGRSESECGSYAEGPERFPGDA